MVSYELTSQYRTIKWPCFYVYWTNCLASKCILTSWYAWIWWIVGYIITLMISFWPFQFGCQDRLVWEDPYLPELNILMKETINKCSAKTCSGGSTGWEKTTHKQTRKEMSFSINLHSESACAVKLGFGGGRTVRQFSFKEILLQCQPPFSVLLHHNLFSWYILSNSTGRLLPFPKAPHIATFTWWVLKKSSLYGKGKFAPIHTWKQDSNFTLKVWLLQKSKSEISRFW